MDTYTWLPITMNFDRDSMWLDKQLTHKIVYEYYLILHRKIIIGSLGKLSYGFGFCWSLPCLLYYLQHLNAALNLKRKCFFVCQCGESSLAKGWAYWLKGKPTQGKDWCFVSVQWVLPSLSHRVEESAAENVQNCPIPLLPHPLGRVFQLRQGTPLNGKINM